MERALDSGPHESARAQAPTCYPVSVRADDDSCRGYLADSEGIPHGPRITIARDRPGVPQKIYHVHGTKKESRLMAHRYADTRCPRRRRGRGKPYHSRRWIQRIYSHTPHKFSIVSDINALDDISNIRHAADRICPAKAPFLSLLQQARPLARDFRISCFTPPRVHSAMVAGDEAPEVQQHDEYAALMHIISALREDYHRTQVQYQSYAPLSANTLWQNVD
jgi:hypothetical protein